MKKRFWCLLLLTAMLLTSVPLGTAALQAPLAPSPQPQSETSVAEELYVKEGLTSRFSALTPSDSSVSKAAGFWQNRVTGVGNATLGNSSLWTRNANGSIGFNLFYGELSDEGVYNATSKYTTFNHDTSLGTNLNFGIELLPADDFTVEYVAQYKPIYVADKFGNVALDENGDPVEAYSYGNVKMKDPGSIDIYGAELRIGYLANYVYPTDGNWSGSPGNRRGDGMWTISSSATWYRTNSSHFTTASTDPVKNNAFTENAGVRTYAITREENPEDNGCAVYRFIRNGALHTLKEFDSSKVVPNANGYMGVDFSVAEKDLPATMTGVTPEGHSWQTNTSKYFYISERRPTDFYAVRIYDRVLSAEELAQNHFVDIVIYYGLELDERIFENTAAGKALLKDCASALNTAEIVTDTFLKSVNREEYQAALDLAVFNLTYTPPCNYDELYTTRDLVALYTAFAGDRSADVVNGVWANKAADQTYGAATLNGAWMKEADGIGYRIEADTISELRSQATKHGISLNDNLANLDNFTVEVFAKVYGATDADGNRVKFSGEPFISHRNNFRFGMLTSLGFSGLYGSTGLKNRWVISNIEHTGSNWTAAQAFNPDAAAKYGKTIDDTNWYKMGTAVPTPGIMTATKATAANGDVSYAVSYNNATTAAVSFDVPKATHDALALVTSSDDITGRRFSLFNTMPATVYAVRVYSRELTTAEAIQNAFVDKAAFYRVDLTGYEQLPLETQEAIKTRFAVMGTDLDAAEAQEIYNSLADQIPPPVGDADIFCHPGQTFDVIVSTDEYVDIQSGSIQLTYNTEIFDLVAGTWMISDAALKDFTVENAKGVFAMSGTKSVSGDFFRFTLRVKDTVGRVATALDVRMQLLNSANEKHTPTISYVCQVTAEHVYTDACDTACNANCGETRVAPHSYTSDYDHDCNGCGYERYQIGDVDRNGKKNSDDAVYLLYHIFHGAVLYPVDQPLDFNADTRVDTDDALHLLYNTFFGDTLYPLRSAVCEPPSPTVFQLTFDTQGGSLIEPLLVEAGQMPILPSDPTREGYIFTGWYMDAACAEMYVAEEITEDMVLYAGWERDILADRANELKDYMLSLIHDWNFHSDFHRVLWEYERFVDEYYGGSLTEDRDTYGLLPVYDEFMVVYGEYCYMLEEATALSDFIDVLIEEIPDRSIEAEEAFNYLSHIEIIKDYWGSLHRITRCVMECEICMHIFLEDNALKLYRAEKRALVAKACYDAYITLDPSRYDALESMKRRADAGMTAAETKEEIDLFYFEFISMLDGLRVPVLPGGQDPSADDIEWDLLD